MPHSAPRGITTPVICHARLSILPLDRLKTLTVTRGCGIEWPMTEPAPVVTAHAGGFRDIFDHRCQVWSFQYSLNRFIGLSHKTMADIVRCTPGEPRPNKSLSLSGRGSLAGRCGQSPPHSLHAPAD